MCGRDSLELPAKDKVFNGVWASDIGRLDGAATCCVAAAAAAGGGGGGGGGVAGVHRHVRLCDRTEPADLGPCAALGA